MTSKLSAPNRLGRRLVLNVLLFVATAFGLASNAAASPSFYGLVLRTTSAGADTSFSLVQVYDWYGGIRPELDEHEELFIASPDLSQVTPSRAPDRYVQLPDGSRAKFDYAKALQPLAGQIRERMASVAAGGPGFAGASPDTSEEVALPSPMASQGQASVQEFRPGALVMNVKPEHLPKDFFLISPSGQRVPFAGTAMLFGTVVKTNGNMVQIKAVKIDLADNEGTIFGSIASYKLKNGKNFKSGELYWVPQVAWIALPASPSR